MTGFESASFRTMGTGVEVLSAPGLPRGSVARVRERFASMEATFSRFVPGSELSRVNRSAGRRVVVSDLFGAVLSDAIEAAKDAEGLFDPLILSEVRAAGYRESIDVVGRTAQVATPVAVRATYRDIRVSALGVLVIPEGSGLDFGGFVKGWTVDRCGPLMTGSSNWLINAGGDLLARGEGPEGNGWVVGVEDPFAPGRTLAVVVARDSAIATSSTMRRRWATQAGVAHHLIDPRSGRPSETDVASVTVAAKTVARAEVLAKQMLLLGSAQGQAWAAMNDVAALLVGADGSVAVTDAMRASVVI